MDELNFNDRGWRQLEPFSLPDGSAAIRWLCDPAGEGIGVLRSASHDFASVDAQLNALCALHDRGRRLREIVVSVGLSGNRRFHERPDLLAVEAAVVSKPSWVRFVAFTDVTRISRAMDGAMLFAEFVHENNVELVLLDHGDQATDVVGSPEFRLLAMVATEERSAIVQRMQTGKLLRREQAETTD